MRQHEQALLLMKRAAEDASLLVEVLSWDRISNEIFGFHAQQAAENFSRHCFRNQALTSSPAHTTFCNVTKGLPQVSCDAF